MVKYDLAGEGQVFNAEGFADYLAGLSERYPIISIEDGMDESDWAGWKVLTDKIGEKVQLVGDDLFVTNTKILKAASTKDRQLDPDQVQPDRHPDRNPEAIQMAKAAGYTAVISHRSGETEDRPLPTWPWVLLLARSKPVRCAVPIAFSKYNQLLRIEEQLGQSPYKGRAEFRG